MVLTFPRPSLSFQTAGFPRYGWKAGMCDTFPQTKQLKPALGIPQLICSLCQPFAYIVATSVVPFCVGPNARSCAAVEMG